MDIIEEIEKAFDVFPLLTRIIQEKLANGPFLSSMLPKTNPPLSTFRIISSSKGGLHVGKCTRKDIKALSCVWRAGRANAATDHTAILYNVDPTTGKFCFFLGGGGMPCCVFCFVFWHGLLTVFGCVIDLTLRWNIERHLEYTLVPCKSSQQNHHSQYTFLYHPPRYKASNHRSDRTEHCWHYGIRGRRTL